MEGVQEDCEILLLQYDKTKSLRFSDFIKVWQEMKFSLIFSQRSLSELDLFIPELFMIIKKYFIRAVSFTLKVGALYLLYGLYYKQPLKGYKKILITQSDWTVMHNFIKDVELGQHYDTLLVMYKLISDNAFSWSVLHSERKYLMTEKISTHGLFETKSLLEDWQLEKQLNELNNIEEEYQEALNEIVKMDSNNQNILLNYSNCKFSKELNEILVRENNTDKIASKDEQPQVRQTKDSPGKKNEDIGARRRALKNRKIEKRK